MMFEEQAARTLCLEQGEVTLLQAKPGQRLPCPQGVHPAHMLTSDARARFAALSGMLVKDILMRLNVRPETSVFSAAPPTAKSLRGRVPASDPPYATQII